MARLDSGPFEIVSISSVIKAKIKLKVNVNIKPAQADSISLRSSVVTCSLLLFDMKSVINPVKAAGNAPTMHAMLTT